MTTLFDKLMPFLATVLVILQVGCSKEKMTNPQETTSFKPSSVTKFSKNGLTPDGASAKFSYVMDSLDASFVSFQNLSVKAIAYVWNFGDGTIDTLKNPNHRYPMGGNYTVFLTIKSPGGYIDTVSQVISIVKSTKLVADFTFTRRLDSLGNTHIYFTNISKNAIRYNWNFGDGTTDTVENPIHMYNGSGVYTVKLTATNSTGKSETKIAIIVIPRVYSALNPVADFSFTRKDSIVGTDTLRMVQFNNFSQNATSYEWNFGDGSTTSTEVNPFHVYLRKGRSIDATLTAKNRLGKSSSFSRRIF